MRVCMYIHGVRCISYYRPQNGGQYFTGPEVQHQLYNEQVGSNCVPELYLSTTLLCTVPCILCRHVLVAVTTERSSVPATMSPLDGRIITWVLYNVEGEGEWQKEGVLRCTCV